MRMMDMSNLRVDGFSVYGLHAISCHWKDGYTYKWWNECEGGRPNNAFHFIRHGRIRYTDHDGNVVVGGRGDVIYIPHGCRYSQVGVVGGDSEGKHIRVDWTMEDMDHRNFAFCPSVVRVGRDAGGEIATLFKDMCNVYRTTGNQLKMLSLCLTLFDKLATRDAEEELDMEHCGDYIRQNLMMNLSVAGLAEHYRVSETTFRKRFFEIYGVNPSKYINDCKMQLACELLRTGDISTEEIVRLLGFYDMAYFHKRMKASYGMTPAEFRRVDRQRGEDADKSDGIG